MGVGSPLKNKSIKIIGLISKVILCLLAISIAGMSLFAIVDVERQTPIFQRLVRVVPSAGYAHIIAGSIALILGGFQLSSRLRRKNLNLHKLIGKAYVVCVLASTVGAIINLSMTSSPWPAKSEFWLVAIVWPIVTLVGYPRGENFDIRWHGRLMIISYALTCTAISLRFLLTILLVSGVRFPVAYPIAAWGGLVINIAIAGFVLRIAEMSRKNCSHSTIADTSDA